MNIKPNNDKEVRKRLLAYYAIVLIVIFVLNWVVFPMIAYQKQVTSTYSDFLNALDDNKVVAVEIEDAQISYVVKEGERNLYFKTGVVDDPTLIEKLHEKDIPFGKAIPERPNIFLSFLMSYIFPIVLFMLMGRFLAKNFQKRMGGAGLNIGGQKVARVYKPEEGKKTFDDVAGQEEAKESLIEIIDFLKNPKKYEEIGAKCPKGVLLVGPPGTGKTLIAKAVAGEADVPFFAISGSEFVEMFVGRGAAKVRELFDQASKHAPCIVFIDEIDTIGKKRDGSMTSNDEREQTLNQLLTEMDGFESNKGVIILAATNRPEILDPALLRPGRFDRQVRMELPDLQGRIDILKVHLRGVKTDGNIDHHLIARMTAGVSGAEVANIVNEAALRAVRMNRDTVSTHDLEESIETVIAGQQKKNAILSDEEKRIVAYHEIGHALVAAKQKNAAPVQKITIIPRTSGALGYTMQVEEADTYLLTKEKLLQKIEVLCGGRAAEEVVFNQITTGASNDIERATQISRQMVTKYGMSERFNMMALETSQNRYLGGDSTLTCSSETSKLIDEEVLNIIKTSHENAKKSLEENIDKLHELSNYLLEKETITGDEFMQILNK
ncbi:MAG: ATP-dependent zinc metalloprotease FtsH [Christensenellaceae bacterium]|nr:ATP-dependent zinc metalloprotease FtsH [Christensenellaceae bacterium]